MSTVREPFDILHEIESLGREAWDSWQPTFLSTTLNPRIDMYAKNGYVVVKVELPGIEKNTINVTLDGSLLRIEAERKEKKDEFDEDTYYYAFEGSYGKYFRSLPLPVPVKADETSARLNNGILYIRLAEAEEANTKHVRIKL